MLLLIGFGYILKWLLSEPSIQLRSQGFSLLFVTENPRKRGCHRFLGVLKKIFWGRDHALAFSICDSVVVSMTVTQTGNHERAVSLHLAGSGSQSQRGIWLILPAHEVSNKDEFIQ